MTTSTHERRLTWTPLGARMGFTRRRTQRAEILAATGRMTWTETPAQAPYLDAPAVHAVIEVVFGHRPDQIRMVGVAGLHDRHRLIGLQDEHGARSYVLDLGSEAIYVLTESPRPLPRRAHVA